MGASSSTEQVSAEQREAESLVASTGALSLLKNAFSNLLLQHHQSIPIPSLQECFELSIDYQTCEARFKPETFPALLNHVGRSIVDQFFIPGKDGLNWISFLNGYTKCCGRMPTSTSLNNLLKVFQMAVVKSGATTGLQVESTEDDYKINGYLLPTDLLSLLWLCWVMSWNSRNTKLSKGSENFGLPDINNLVLSAVSSCGEGGAELNMWDDGLVGSDIQLPIGKLHGWVLKTVPNLPDCLVQFVHSRLSIAASQQDKMEPTSSSTSDSHIILQSSTYLLTPSRAWSISLTLRSTMRDEILKTCFEPDADEVKENMLYRSSIHGKGLNRLWSNVEGYNGPILVLISATSEDHSWIIGALTHQGYENKDTFYGTSGSLYAISPVFDHFASSGKEKNFMYSHLHAPGYEAKPKPVGLAFGGSMGNERVFIDEDFSRITVRHHAYDKTYQPGPLFPNQGYLPTEAHVLDVEVWGLGGEKIKQLQNSLQKREQLFTEQRRKVDLKTFSNWEDSPEKMMMDMVSNPTAVRREKR
ncbi:TLD-domain containing nucleolar protein [Artemisia annua]|uniref:TLD-domain containing nucleolar protein n=1 Tax=Artemisia annua TaxID=35608 RepID=A0A2U1P606_ARTAN|nr:TLD-domain containing nucleolar protein [Artemisia annua]